MAMLTYSVNFNTLWRLPYVSLVCGGGTFLLAVSLLLVVAAVPLLIMETAVGQMTRSGPVRAMGRMCTVAQALGVAMAFLSYISVTYYSVLLSWTLHYTVASTNRPLRWEGCGQVWSRNETCSPPFQEWPAQPVENVSGVLRERRTGESPVEQYLYIRQDGEIKGWDR